MNKKNLQIPEKTHRCVVMIAHPTTHGDLTEDDRTVGTLAKDGNIDLINALTKHFGTPPTVHCGQSNVSIMTAVTSGSHKITTLRLLDAPNSHRQARKRARRLLFETSSKQPLVVAYGDHGIVNKAMGARNAASKTGIKPMAEAVIMFIDKRGQVVGAHKQDLLNVA